MDDRPESGLHRHPRQRHRGPMFDAEVKAVESDGPWFAHERCPWGSLERKAKKWNDRLTLVPRQMPAPDSLHRLTLVTCLIA